MAAPAQLTKPGKFVTQRDLSGAAVADPTDLSEANFPPAGAVSGQGSRSVWVYWEGTGGVVSDTINVQILIRDAINAFWVATPVKTLIRREAQEFPVQGASQIFARIAAESTTATALKIRMAMGETEERG